MHTLSTYRSKGTRPQVTGKNGTTCGQVTRGLERKGLIMNQINT